MMSRNLARYAERPPVLIDLDQIAKVTPLDTKFTPQPIDPARFGAEA